MQKLHGCDRKVYTISVESNCTWIPSERILQGYEKNKEKDGRWKPTDKRSGGRFKYDVYVAYEVARMYMAQDIK